MANKKPPGASLDAVHPVGLPQVAGGGHGGPVEPHRGPCDKDDTQWGTRYCAAIQEAPQV